MRRSASLLTVGAVIGSALLGATGAAAHSAARSARPAAEHVPASVHHVRIAYRDTQDANQNRTVDLHGRHAHHLVRLFNELEREPKNTVHCLVASTASTRVIFRNSDHRWIASEAICTNLTVTRDGKQLPTLIESDAWNNALTHYLGHSPTGTGASPAQ